ncbi:hypothetical protein AB0H83_46375 [Dactylosporangium sp. NPDC050688]|uniref:MmyB family transcriptional regulator n=1 Tax=Dactylosporangium sp. NPDC050688 TaxID=3157217 RepID=UPI0033D31C3F
MSGAGSWAVSVTAGEPLASRVATLPGLPLAHGVLRLVHPEVGELRLAYETLDLPADDDQRLVVHLPPRPPPWTT